MHHAQPIFIFSFLFWCELIYSHDFNFLISLCMKISRIIFDSEVRLFFQCLQTPVLQEAKQRPIIFSDLVCRTTFESCGATFFKHGWESERLRHRMADCPPWFQIFDVAWCHWQQQVWTSVDHTCERLQTALWWHCGCSIITSRGTHLNAPHK